MENYKLCFQENNNKNIYDIISSNSILKIDKYTTNFNNEEELLSYFNCKTGKKLTNGSVFIKNNLIEYPVVYTDYLKYIDNLDMLKCKLMEQSNNFQFLNLFIELFNNHATLSNIKKLKKSIKKIDSYSYDLMVTSSCFRLKYLDNVIKDDNNKLFKRYTLIENINEEYNKIEKNLIEIFNKIVYNEDKLNYLNIRQLFALISNFDDNKTNKVNGERKLVKKINE